MKFASPCAIMPDENTNTQLDGSVDLSDENAQALCDHGAAAPPPATPPSSGGVGGGGGGGSGLLATASGVATPMSVVSTTLHARVEDTDWTVDGVRSLIWPAGDFDLEARDPEGMTMLLLASRHGRGRMVEALLSVGVDTKATDQRGYTAVCWVRPKCPPNPAPRGRGALYSWSCYCKFSVLRRRESFPAKGRDNEKGSAEVCGDNRNTGSAGERRPFRFRVASGYLLGLGRGAAPNWAVRPSQPRRQHNDLWMFPACPPACLPASVFTGFVPKYFPPLLLYHDLS